MFYHYLLNELSPLNRYFVLLWCGLDSLDLPSTILDLFVKECFNHATVTKHRSKRKNKLL